MGKDPKNLVGALELAAGLGCLLVRQPNAQEGKAQVVIKDSATKSIMAAMKQNRDRLANCLAR